MRTLVTGATGLIGKQLLAGIQSPVILSRKAGAAGLRVPVEAHVFAFGEMSEILVGPDAPAVQAGRRVRAASHPAERREQLK